MLNTPRPEVSMAVSGCEADNKSSKDSLMLCKSARTLESESMIDNTQLLGRIHQVKMSNCTSTHTA